MFLSYYFSPTFRKLLFYLPPQDQTYVKFYLSLLGFTEALAIAIRFFRVLLYTKFFYDQLILFNPYKWPLSILHNLTYPYIKFWEKTFPRYHHKRKVLEVSSLVSSEILLIITHLLVVLTKIAIMQIEGQLHHSFYVKKILKDVITVAK